MRTLREALTLFVVLTVVTGIVYPLLVTGIAKALFPERAEGSLIRRGDRIVGSELIGQPFSHPGYLWSRPSATGGAAYNSSLSGGSNLGPLHPALESAVRERVAALRAAAGSDARVPVPMDLVTASGSGLDPHISPEAALYQAARIAAARGVTEKEVASILRRHIEPRQLGFLGEARVNVLLANLDLDYRFGRPRPEGGS